VELDPATVMSLSKGCLVLGGGGGGDATLAALATRIELERTGRTVELVDIDDLSGDALIMPGFALIGAPTIMLEKLWNGDEGFRLREAVETLTGGEVVAVMSAEIGGLNGVLPVFWAARLGLPVVDGDAIGRAFPMVHQTKMHILGITGAPCVLTDERSNTLTVDAATNEWMEELVRQAAQALGGSCAGALYPMTVAVARKAIIRGSVSRAIRIGRVLDEAHEDPVGSLCRELGGVELISGKVVDVERRTGGGFVRGSALVARDGPGREQLLRIEFQNENLAALAEGRVVASVPDVIAALDAHSGLPIQTERLRYGQRVRVIAFPSDPIWRSARGLEIAGPAAFGYEFPYVPVEDLVGATA
jgi:hypothetical protein